MVYIEALSQISAIIDECDRDRLNLWPGSLSRYEISKVLHSDCMEHNIEMQQENIGHIQ